MQTEQVNSESDDSGDASAQRYILFKTKTYCHFCFIVQALLNLNIHTSYFLHVWIIRTNSSQREKNSHEFVTDFERIFHTRVTYKFHTSFICSMNANSSHCSKYP